MTIQLKQWRQHTADGAELLWMDSATENAPAFVLLHPMPADHRFWLPLVEQLGPGYRYLLPDLRGHGGSTLGHAETTIAQMAADIFAGLEAQGVEQAIFTGCSIGGYVLFELWRQRPEIFRAMAFLCSKPQPETEAALAKRQETIAKAEAGGQAFVEGFLDNMAQTMTGKSVREENSEICAEVRNHLSFTPEALVAVQRAIAGRADSRPTLATITVPVLAVAGAEDAGIPPQDVREIAEKAPHAEFHVIEKAGHYAPFELPEAVAAVLKPWLAGV